MDTGSATLMGYHTVGLCIVVPGIGSGSCDIDRAPFLIIFLKFQHDTIIAETLNRRIFQVSSGIVHF